MAYLVTPLVPQNPFLYYFQVVVVCPQTRVSSCKGVNLIDEQPNGPGT